MSGELHPFAPFAVAALLVMVVRGRLRAPIMLAAPLVGAWHLLGAEPGTMIAWQILDLTLVPYRVDDLSLLFGYIFHLGAFLGVLFALHVRDTLQHVAALLYAGAAIGAVFAGDLFTLFIYWEILGLSSAFLVWAARGGEAVGAGIRYLLFQVLSGVLLMAGAIWHYLLTGDLTFDEIGLSSGAAWLIFLAFGIKCGFPLLHGWLTDAYPASTPTGTVFLCMFTTKTAIYALARGFPGTELLVYIGAVMACFPIFYAVIENDLRRVLSYSMINQLGFMVCGIGVGTAVALNGAVAHAFNDVLFKGLLMMSMGAVLHVTGRSRASDLGGLYRTMPVTAALCVIGAMTISAFPLFSAFISKSMIMQGLLDEGYQVVWLVMLLASAGVLEHAGIKIPWFAFFAHDARLPAREPPANMLLAMFIAAALCIALGSWPGMLYAILPWEADFSPYDLTHVLAQMQLLGFAILGVVFLHRSGLYPAELPSRNLDVDWFYRRLLPQLAGQTVRALERIRIRSVSALRRWHGGASTLAGTGVRSALSRQWPTGSMVMWVAVFLALMLFAGLLNRAGH
jgi:multicomponent Na+:H+ antiporter subunit D